MKTVSLESSEYRAANRFGVTNIFDFLSATFGEIDELERLRLLGIDVWSGPPPVSWTLSTILSDGKRDNGAHKQLRACTLSVVAGLMCNKLLLIKSFITNNNTDDHNAHMVTVVISLVIQI